MPNYDLSSIGALAAASELARTRADQEPSQDSDELFPDPPLRKMKRPSREAVR